MLFVEIGTQNFIGETVWVRVVYKGLFVVANMLVKNIIVRNSFICALCMYTSPENSNEKQ